MEETCRNGTSSEIEIPLAEGISIKEIVLIATSAVIAQRCLHIAVDIIQFDWNQTDACDGDQSWRTC
jgi:hypothetical protein